MYGPSLFASLVSIFALLLTSVTATEGDDLAQKICSTYHRPGKLYCVTTLSYVICIDGTTELEQATDLGYWCKATGPYSVDGNNEVLPTHNLDMWALPYMRPGINLEDEEQDSNGTRSEQQRRRQKVVGTRFDGMNADHASEL
ncbi:hypothetical protein LTS08_001033 [Lithohypha guttulata]|uniref:Uncharacterized protein n=1 Tax=Lithohypha guttulata TaxID=1690604 RepID=A0AAN7YIB4_9EURO|nr:hypothetical protein LTR51_006355 [Lithohypha guttulata]KAK5088561.1 hypothetical protein LTR05_002781 [Lithohypha guttulata]KAK5106910.1 hypothetical protein LTS08_001033 [Lithohypha guttulata]